MFYILSVKILATLYPSAAKWKEVVFKINATFPLISNRLSLWRTDIS